MLNALTHVGGGQCLHGAVLGELELDITRAAGKTHACRAINRQEGGSRREAERQAQLKVCSGAAETKG